MRRLTIRAVMALAVLTGAAEAQSLFGGGQMSALTLHSGWAENDKRMAGLRMELAEGWKTYWRNPGDAGVPPQFDWSGSENLAAAEIHWPAPHVFETYGTRTIGYKERLVLPLTLTPVDPGLPIVLRLGVSYGVCSDICVPRFEELTLTIPPGAPEDGGYFIRRALAELPAPAAEAGISAQCAVEGAGPSRRFSAEIRYEAPPAAAPVVVVEGPEGVWFGPVDARIGAGGVLAEGPVETEEGRWIDRSRLRLTILGEHGAADLNGCATGG